MGERSRKIMQELGFNQNTRSSVQKLYDISFLIYICVYFTGGMASSITWLVSFVFLAAALLLIAERRFVRVDSVTKWYVLFIIFSLLSQSWAADSSRVTELTVTFVRTLILGISVYNRIRNKHDIDTILKMYVFAVCFRSVVVFTNMFLKYGTYGLLFVRFGDELGYNSNSTAVLAVFSILICLYFLNEKDCGVWLYRLAILFLGFVILISRSKKGIFGLLIGLIVFLYFNETGMKKVKNVILGIAIIAALYYAVLNIPFLYQGIGFRIESMIQSILGTSSMMTSTDERTLLIEQGFELWKNNKLLGVGLNNFTLFQTVREGYYAHCNYIELMADLGLVGLVLYYFMPIHLILKKYQSNKLTLMFRIILLMVLFFDISMVSYQEASFTLLFWIILAYSNLYKTHERGSEYC